MKPLPQSSPPEWLFAFDFDGTLAEADAEPVVDASFFECLRQLRQSHHVYWGVNTGRPLMFALEGIAQARFPFHPDYIIAREREIYTPNAFGRWVGVRDWNAGSEKAHQKLFRKHRRLLKRIQKWVESETAAVWGQQEGEPAGLVASTAGEMDGIVRRIDAEIAGAAMLSYQRNGIYLRFSHSDYHKGTAMVELARLLSLGVDRVLAVGDSHNDLDMLNTQMAALIACPGNSCEEVKSQVAVAGGYVAAGHASKGVIETLRHFFDLS